MADAESPRRRRRNRSRACEPGRYLTGFGRGAILTQSPAADHSTEPAARGPVAPLSSSSRRAVRRAAVEMVTGLVVVVVVVGAGGSPAGPSSLGAFGACKAWSFHASQGLSRLVGEGLRRPAPGWATWGFLVSPCWPHRGFGWQSLSWVVSSEQPRPACRTKAGRPSRGPADRGVEPAAGGGCQGSDGSDRLADEVRCEKKPRDGAWAARWPPGTATSIHGF